LLNFASENSDQLLKKIDEISDALAKGNINASLGIFMKYLTLPDTLNRLCANNTKQILMKLIDIFNVLADRKVVKIVDHLESLKFDEKLPELEYSELDNIAEEYMYAIAQRVLIIAYSSYSKISKEMESDRKAKLKELQEAADENLEFYSLIYEKISSCAEQIFYVTHQVASDYLEIATAKHLKEKEEQKDEKEPKYVVKKQYIEFHSHLYHIVKNNNKFLDFIHIYVACVASSKEHKMTKHLNHMCDKTIRVLNAFSKYA
jgi:hypothetical protein